MRRKTPPHHGKALTFFVARIAVSTPVLATSKLYRRAVVQAIDELRDLNLPSNIDSIRRHVQSALGPEAIWNDAMFLLTMKSLSSERCIEPLESVNYGLSPEFKRRMIHIALEAVEKREEEDRIHLHHHQSHEPHEKEIPVKKMEHTKLKIIPKKIFDGLQ